MQDHLRSGGTERQSVFLTEALRTAGHDATLLTFRPGGVLRPPPGSRALQSRDWGWDWYAPGLRRAVAKIDPDVIVAMGRMANCHLWRVRGRAKTVATFRTGKSLPLLFRHSLRQADAVVANSAEAAATLTARYGISTGKIHVIYNALLFTPETGLRDSVRREFGVADSAVVFLCVAMFRPEKNQRELIEIAAGFDPGAEWQLWLAGDGPARADCERRVRELGLERRVRFLGLRPDPRPLYQAADVAVHASWSEALSNFLIEAQAFGVPGIAYQAQGISECFRPGETGWVIPRGDRAAFVQAAARLIQAGAEGRARIAASARAFAREHFDPAAQTAAYLRLFENLLSPSRS